MAVTRELVIKQIVVEGYATPLDDGRVTTMVESIKQHGLINPIRVRRKHDVTHLVAGRHRLEAFRRLERATILCTIEDEEDDAAEMTRIAENLHRGQMSLPERAAAKERYSALLKAVLPLTEAEQPKSGSRAKGKLHSGSERDVAKRLGEPHQTTSNDLRVGRALREVDIDASALGGTHLSDQAELRALTKLPPRERKQIADRAIAGERVSARAALQTLIGQGKVAPPKRRARSHEYDEPVVPRGFPTDPNTDYEPDKLKEVFTEFIVSVLHRYPKLTDDFIRAAFEDALSLRRKFKSVPGARA